MGVGAELLSFGYPRALTVYELTKRVKAAIEADEGLVGVWVRGEISNFTHHTSGHMYFSLKDDRSRLKCVMFRGQNLRLRFKPKDGQEVFAHGSVNVYDKGGEYQLYVDHMEPAGLGALYAALEELKRALAAEGLFDPAHKRPLPEFPKVVGVVTSPTGAAIRDIIKVARRRNPAVRIVVVPAQVQGDDAPESIVNAIGLANRFGAFDVLIVARGGGSMEDLWCFNDERVARAIYGSAIPVVSAVGHEVDYTIADFVADVRAATPSHAAELVVPDISEYIRRLSDYRNRAGYAALGALRQARRRLEAITASREIRRPMDRIEQARQRVDDAAAAAQRLMLHRLEIARQRIAALAGKADALSPLSVLSRGYAVVRDSRGRVVRYARAVAVGEDVEVILSSGRLICEVKETRD